MIVSPGVKADSYPMILLSIVNQCAREILLKIKYKDIYSVIIESIYRIINKSRVTSILILDQNEQSLKVVSSRGFPARFINDFDLKVGMGVSGKAAASGESIIIPDIRTCQDIYYQDIARELDLGAMASIPLKLLNRVVGVLDVFLARPEQFSPVEIQLLELVADFATIAIQNAHSYRNIKQTQLDLDSISHIARDIKSSLDLNQLLEKILTNAFTVVHTNLGFIYHQDYFTRKWHAFLPPHLKNGVLSLPDVVSGAGILGRVMTTGKPYICNDAQHDKNYHAIWPQVRSKITLPVLIDSSVHALLDIESKAAFAFGKREEKLLTILAEGAAIAIKNLQIFKIAEKKTQEVIKLNSISEAIGSQKSLQEILDLIANQSLDIVGRGNKAAFVLLKDAARNTLIIKAACGESFAKGFLEHSVSVSSKGIVAKVCRTGKYCLAKNVRENEDYIEIHPEIRSELAIPLFTHGEVIGVINIESTEPDAFNEQDVELLRTLADNAAVATKVAELYQIRLKQLEAINRISNKINSSLNLQKVLNSIAHEALRAIGRANRVVYVQLIDEATDILETRAAAGNLAMKKYLGTKLSKDRGISGQVILHKKYYLCSDVSKDAFYVCIDPKVKSELCVPILLRGEPMGTINSESTVENDFSIHEYELLNGLANQAGVAIYNARLNETITSAQFELAKMTEMASVGEALAGLSHDIRSNYSLIAGEAQWIAHQIKNDKISDREILDCMEKIQNYVRLVEKLTQDLSIRIHRIPVQFVRHDIASTVKQSVLLMISQARRHQVKILVNYKSLRFEAEIDENRLKRTLINIIMNAIEAMPNGGRLRIEGEKKLDSFTIRFADTGTGIPPEIIDKVCDRFFSTKNSFGLGLAICKSIIENDHNGKFLINSVQGQGTQILVQLPYFRR